MANVYQGIAIILIVIIMYYFSWKKYLESRFALALFLIVCAGLILRIYTSMDFYLHSWDERYHALVAKNFLIHPLLPALYDNPVLGFNYQVWISNNVWLHKPPLALWLISISLKTFGLSEFAVRIPSIIMSTLGILVTFKITDELFNKRSAFIAAFLYSIHGLIIELSAGRVSTDHVDISFMFFILLSVYFSVRFAKTNKIENNILAGLVLGLAVLTKLYAAFVVVPIWFFLVLNYNGFKFKDLITKLVVLVMTSSIVFLPWIIYVNIYFPKEALWESKMSLFHFTTIVEQRTGSVFFHLENMRLLFGEGIYLSLIWFIYQTFKKKMNFNYLALLIWITLPLLVYTIALTKMQAYMMIASPAIFIVSALFIDYLLININSSRYKWLTIIILFFLLGLPLRYSIERIKPFTEMNRSPEWSNKTKIIAKELNGKNAILFGYDRPIETMFYCDGTVYSEVPDIKIINKVKEGGFNVFIYNNKDGKISPF